MELEDGGTTAANPAVVIAKEKTKKSDGPVVLSTGVEAYLRPVSASLVEEVISQIAEPPVPVWHNPDKDRDEPNPADPAYLKAKEDMNRRRGTAAIDAVYMFGVTLAQPVPDDGWEKKLERLGIHVADDQFEREFAYKKYVAVATQDLARLMALSGISQGEVNRQLESFPGAP